MSTTVYVEFLWNWHRIIFRKALCWKNFLCYLHLLKEHSKRANYNMDSIMYTKIMYSDLADNHRKKTQGIWVSLIKHPTDITYTIYYSLSQGELMKRQSSLQVWLVKVFSVFPSASAWPSFIQHCRKPGTYN